MGATVDDKSAGQIATVGLLGTGLVWLWTPFDEIIPLTVLGYTRLAILIIVSAGWVVVVAGLTKQTPDAHTRSEQRLQQAVAQPGAAAAGVTVNWCVNSTSTSQQQINFSPKST